MVKKIKKTTIAPNKKRIEISCPECNSLIKKITVYKGDEFNITTKCPKCNKSIQVTIKSKAVSKDYEDNYNEINNLAKELITYYQDFEHWLEEFGVENIKEAIEKGKEVMKIGKKNLIKMKNIFKETKFSNEDKKDALSLFKTIKNKLYELEKNVKQWEIVLKSGKKTFPCPICNRMTTAVLKAETEVRCKNCSKTFFTITGIIDTILGRRTAVMAFGPDPINIRLKTENGLKSISFFTGNRFLVKRGDEVTLIFMKKFLSSDYSGKPHSLIDWNSGENWKL